MITNLKINKILMINEYKISYNNYKINLILLKYLINKIFDKFYLNLHK